MLTFGGEWTMRATKWMTASVLGIFLLTANFAMAQGKGKGNGHGKGQDKHGENDDQGEYYYNHHDQEAIHGWYLHNENHLPPGLAKKDRLPPGLEKQLVRRGTLPPGLQKRIEPCPREVERMLPPPPPDCANVLIGGHIVLFNKKTNIVIDVFNFDI
jgi:hypothetical protein